MRALPRSHSSGKSSKFQNGQAPPFGKEYSLTWLGQSRSAPDV